VADFTFGWGDRSNRFLHASIFLCLKNLQSTWAGRRLYLTERGVCWSLEDSAEVLQCSRSDRGSWESERMVKMRRALKKGAKLEELAVERET